LVTILTKELYNILIYLFKQKFVFILFAAAAVVPPEQVVK